MLLIYFAQWSLMSPLNHMRASLQTPLGQCKHTRLIHVYFAKFFIKQKLRTCNIRMYAYIYSHVSHMFHVPHSSCTTCFMYHMLYVPCVLCTTSFVLITHFMYPMFHNHSRALYITACESHISLCICWMCYHELSLSHSIVLNLQMNIQSLGFHDEF